MISLGSRVAVVRGNPRTAQKTIGFAVDRMLLQKHVELPDSNVLEILTVKYRLDYLALDGATQSLGSAPPITPQDKIRAYATNMPI